MELTKRGHILLVDDEETFLHATADLLRREGYFCDTAVDARQAREHLQGCDYDVIISDIRMPGNSNLEFVHELAQIAPDLHVILVTGYPSLETAIESVHLPVVAYLVKPVDFGELLEHVRKALVYAHTKRLLRELRRRLQQHIQHCEDLQQRVPGGGETQVTETVLAVFEMIFQHIVDSYVDLKKLVVSLAEVRPDIVRSGLRNDPRHRSLVEAIREAVAVLEQTKRAFKSKQLGQLRQHLESVLEEAELR